MEGNDKHGQVETSTRNSLLRKLNKLKNFLFPCGVNGLIQINQMFNQQNNLKQIKNSTGIDRKIHKEQMLITMPCLTITC